MTGLPLAQSGFQGVVHGLAAHIANHNHGPIVWVQSLLVEIE
jgi:hypothetical protein